MYEKKKMGSIEVYDAKQRKWVPYVPDYEKWRQHFHDIQEGYAKPDHMGRYVVGSGRRHRKLKEMEAQQRQKEIEMLEAQRPVVKLVSPVAQAVEMVKSNMDREKRERRQSSTTGGEQHQRKKNKESIDWNTFRY